MSRPVSRNPSISAFGLLGLALAFLGDEPIAGAAAADRGDAPAYIKSITLGGNTIDTAHRVRWKDWVIGFGGKPPFSTFDVQGTELHGLSCTHAPAKTVGCSLFMAMKPFESFARNCELRAERHSTVGSWPVRIDCPTEIDYTH